MENAIVQMERAETKTLLFDANFEQKQNQTHKCMKKHLRETTCYHLVIRICALIFFFITFCILKQ